MHLKMIARKLTGNGDPGPVQHAPGFSSHCTGYPEEGKKEKERKKGRIERIEAQTTIEHI